MTQRQVPVLDTALYQHKSAYRETDLKKRLQNKMMQGSMIISS